MSVIPTSLSSRTTLSDGATMPMFGIGTSKSKSGSRNTAETSVAYALKYGYRLVDTAERYGNETDVGVGIKKSGVKREDIFVVTKLFDLGYERCRDAFAASLKRLDTGYVDLYLLHSPQVGKVVESYKAMLELQAKGLIRSVGVSNFHINHLEGMKKAGLPTPTVNQFELHPFMKKQDLVEYCRSNNITVMGYSPLVKGQRFDDPTLVEMANRLGKSTASLLLRYSVQMGYITIPKSEKSARVAENTHVFDWQIPQKDMDILNTLPEEGCAWNPMVLPWRG